MIFPRDLLGKNQAFPECGVSTSAHRKGMGIWPAVRPWSLLAKPVPSWPCSTGGMYHGDLTEKLKALYKLHLPPGE